MTPPDLTQGAQSIYNFWLGLVSQFVAPLTNPAGKRGKADAAIGGDSARSPLEALAFPADPLANAASMTQQSLQAFVQSVAPMLQSAASNPFQPWSAALPWLAPGKAGQAASMAAAQAMLAPWSAFMPGAVGTWPMPLGADASRTSAAGATSTLPLQAMSQAWLNWSSTLAGATPAQFATAFDRTYGALSDALGLGPVRQLHGAWQDMLSAGLAQHEARATYATLVQRAFAQGLQRLASRLAEKADAGERVDSVVALLRLWAINTEAVVHETLQSEAGLAATAALTRSAVAYRRRMQHVIALLADQFDLATRRDLDEAYREIQALKRELRGARLARESVPAQKAPAGIGKTPASRKRKATTTRKEPST